VQKAFSMPLAPRRP